MLYSRSLSLSLFFLCQPPFPRSAVLLDLNIDRLTHTSYSTVAASRICSREDLLILRPFPLWLFQRGAPDGPELLLKKLRGELNLQDIREARWPERLLFEMQRNQTLEAFSDLQWKRIQATKPAECLNCQNVQTNGKRKKTTLTLIGDHRQLAGVSNQSQGHRLAFPGPVTLGRLSRRHATRCLGSWKHRLGSLRFYGYPFLKFGGIFNRVPPVHASCL